MGCQDGRKHYWEYDILVCRICRTPGPKEDFHYACTKGHPICDACFRDARRQADFDDHTSVSCPCGRTIHLAEPKRLGLT